LKRGDQTKKKKKNPLGQFKKGGSWSHPKKKKRVRSDGYHDESNGATKEGIKKGTGYANRTRLTGERARGEVEKKNRHKGNGEKKDPSRNQIKKEKEVKNHWAEDHSMGKQ